MLKLHTTVSGLHSILILHENHRQDHVHACVSFNLHVSEPASQCQGQGTKAQNMKMGSYER